MQVFIWRRLEEWKYYKKAQSNSVGEGNDGQHYADSDRVGDLRSDRACDPGLQDEKESSALTYFRKTKQATMMPARESGLRAALPLIEATGDERVNGPEIEALFR